MTKQVQHFKNIIFRFRHKNLNHEIASPATTVIANLSPERSGGEVKQNKFLYYNTITTPIGKMLVALTDKGVFLVEFPITSSIDGILHKYNAQPFSFYPVLHKEKTKDIINQILLYFKGKLPKFNIPLDISGTQFQVKVWKELLRIPFGHTKTYGEIAERIGQPKAARAVGMANHFNRIGLVVPCHRVIAANGKLGGYAGGLEIKKRLLEHEKRYS